MENNQIQIHAGDPWCSALLRWSGQGILSPKEWLYFQSRCADTLRGNAARTFFFLIALEELYSQELEACIPLGGRKGVSCRCGALPINTFLQLLLHLTLIHGALPLADMKRPSRIFYRQQDLTICSGHLWRTGRNVWGWELINRKCFAADGSGQTWERRSFSGRFTACQKLRLEECPPAVRKRGPWEGELDRLRHLYITII